MERPIKLKDLKPGALVVQSPKQIVRTEWTEDGITLYYADGTCLAGKWEDAVFVEVPDAGGDD